MKNIPYNCNELIQIYKKLSLMPKNKTLPAVRVSAKQYAAVLKRKTEIEESENRPASIAEVIRESIDYNLLTKSIHNEKERNNKPNRPETPDKQG